MKIIERMEWVHVFTCSGCKSRLEAEPGDVKCGSFGGSYCENGDEGFYVDCAVCGTELRLWGSGDGKAKDPVFVPEDIKNRARAEYRKR